LRKSVDRARNHRRCRSSIVASHSQPSRLTTTSLTLFDKFDVSSYQVRDAQDDPEDDQVRRAPPASESDARRSRSKHLTLYAAVSSDRRRSPSTVTLQCRVLLTAVTYLVTQNESKNCEKNVLELNTRVQNPRTSTCNSFLILETKNGEGRGEVSRTVANEGIGFDVGCDANIALTRVTRCSLVARRGSSWKRISIIIDIDYPRKSYPRSNING